MQTRAMASSPPRAAKRQKTNETPVVVVSSSLRIVSPGCENDDDKIARVDELLYNVIYKSSEADVVEKGLTELGNSFFGGKSH